MGFSIYEPHVHKVCIFGIRKSGKRLVEIEGGTNFETIVGKEILTFSEENEEVRTPGRGAKLNIKDRKEQEMGAEKKLNVG